MNPNTPRRMYLIVIAAWVLCFLTVEPVLAQLGEFSGAGRPGTVSGTGISTVEKKPEVMRMHIQLMAKAGSLKEALQTLGTRKETARKTLEKLGAEMDSIKFGDPSISNAQSEQQRQMAQMIEMMQQQRRQTGRRTDNETSAPITVTCFLTVDWKLEFESAQDLLLFVHPLQQELRDADLSGSKDVSALTAEQEELIEEMQGEFGYDMGYYSSGEQEPGTPVFTFVATISEEEHDRALAAAFQQAKSDAARLSKATGSELGKLVAVTSDSQGGDEYASYDEQQYYLAQRLQAIGASQTPNGREAVGAAPGTVKKRFAVTAWFDFKE